MKQIRVTLLKDTPELKVGSIYRTYTEKEFIERSCDQYEYNSSYVYCFYTDYPNKHQHPEILTTLDHSFLNLSEVLMSIANDDGWYKLEVVEPFTGEDPLLVI